MGWAGMGRIQHSIARLDGAGWMSECRPLAAVGLPEQTQQSWQRARRGRTSTEVCTGARVPGAYRRTAYGTCPRQRQRPLPAPPCPCPALPCPAAGSVLWRRDLALPSPSETFASLGVDPTDRRRVVACGSRGTFVVLRFVDAAADKARAGALPADEGWERGLGARGAGAAGRHPAVGGRAGRRWRGGRVVSGPGAGAAAQAAASGCAPSAPPRDSQRFWWRIAPGHAVVASSPLTLLSTRRPLVPQVQSQQYQVDVGSGAGGLRCTFSCTRDLLYVLLPREVSLSPGPQAPPFARWRVHRRRSGSTLRAAACPLALLNTARPQPRYPTPHTQARTLRAPLPPCGPLFPPFSLSRGRLSSSTWKWASRPRRPRCPPRAPPSQTSSPALGTRPRGPTRTRGGSTPSTARTPTAASARGAAWQGC